MESCWCHTGKNCCVHHQLTRSQLQYWKIVCRHVPKSSTKCYNHRGEAKNMGKLGENVEKRKKWWMWRCDTTILWPYSQIWAQLEWIYEIYWLQSTSPVNVYFTVDLYVWDTHNNCSLVEYDYWPKIHELFRQTFSVIDAWKPFTCHSTFNSSGSKVYKTYSLFHMYFWIKMRELLIQTIVF